MNKRELKALIRESVSNIVKEMCEEIELSKGEFEDCKLPDGRFCVTKSGMPESKPKSYRNCYQKGETYNSIEEAPDGYYLATNSSSLNLPTFKHTGKSWMATKWDSEKGRFVVRKKDNGKTFFVSDELMSVIYAKYGIIKLELIDEDYIKKIRGISGALDIVRGSFDRNNSNPEIKNGTLTKFDF